MSLAPPSLPSDRERLKWKSLPLDLVGKVVSLEELIFIFPEESPFFHIQILEEAENYRAYGRKKRYATFFDDEYLAYECKKCNALVVGSPEIQDEDFIGDALLAGKRGYDLHCKQCHALLKDVTIEIS